MTSFFDLAATGIFIAAAGLFLYRLQYEDPSLRPYLIVSGACAIGNWAGDSGIELLAVLLLLAAALLLVHVASAPFEEDLD